MAACAITLGFIILLLKQKASRQKVYLNPLSAVAVIKTVKSILKRSLKNLQTL